MSEAHPVDELRRHEPHSLRVVLLDGTEKPVAVPRIRNRWQRVIQVLDSLPWVRIEALDKSGAVLACVESPEADDGMDVDDDGKRDIGMGRLLLEVMRTTQKESRLMYEAQLKGQASLIESMAQAMGVLVQSYEHSMNVVRTSQLAEAASTSAGSNPEIMAMLQLAMSQLSKPAPQIAARATTTTGEKK